MKEIHNYIESTNWADELLFLRELALSCALVEEIKWEKPAYTHNGQWVVLLQGFKNNFCLLFNKGDLLEDEEKLFSATFKMRDARRMEFTELKQVEEKREQILRYMERAKKLED